MYIRQINFTRFLANIAYHSGRSTKKKTKAYTLTQILVSALVLVSCSNEQQVNEINSLSKTNQSEEEIHFNEFYPDTSTAFQLPDFEILSSHNIQELTILTGRFMNEEIDFSQEEPLDDYGGLRWLAINAKNEIVYKSKGGGDIFVFEPHFYQSKLANKTIIVCQVGFEYYCGADVYLVENNRLTFIGYLDIESDNEDVPLNDILQISERKNELKFTFEGEYLILEPGGEIEQRIKNEVYYTYADSILMFHNPNRSDSLSKQD